MNTESRPATPTLLPGETEKQKGRTKKRRRNHKTRSPQKSIRTSSNPKGKSHQTATNGQQAMQTQNSMESLTPMRMQTVELLNQPVINVQSTMNDSNPMNVLSQSIPSPAILSGNQLIGAHHNSIRLSTSSCSDADNSLKRSKRRRIPNKFYGYTSDDESMSATSALNSSRDYQNPFKPTPPPNLTWSKEDLPKPSKANRTGSLNNLMRINKSGKIRNQRKLPLKGLIKPTSKRKNRPNVSMKKYA